MMLTYRISDSFKTKGNGVKLSSGKPVKPRPDPIPEEEIPPEPPGAMKAEYLRASRAYVRWCIGMLCWSIACVGYFITTGQKTNMVIGISLGVLLVAMIVLPAMLFGGATWYKRLGWEMLLLTLFTAMWVYPIIVCVTGVIQRIRLGRYRWPLYGTDLWHSILVLLTCVMSVWTVRRTIRTGQIVKRLARGEFGVTEISIKS